jgi:hypothetical protein
MGKKLIDMLMIDPAFLPLMRDTVLEALHAQGVHFNKNTGWEYHPDYRTRLDAWKILMAYSEGLPLVRILKQELSDGRRRPLYEELAESPALQEAVERELTKSKFRSSSTGKRMKNAQAVSTTIDLPE